MNSKKILPMLIIGMLFLFSLGFVSAQVDLPPPPPIPDGEAPLPDDTSTGTDLPDDPTLPGEFDTPTGTDLPDDPTLPGGVAASGDDADADVIDGAGDQVGSGDTAHPDASVPVYSGGGSGRGRRGYRGTTTVDNGLFDSSATTSTDPSYPLQEDDQDEQPLVPAQQQPVSVSEEKSFFWWYVLGVVLLLIIFIGWFVLYQRKRRQKKSILVNTLFLSSVLFLFVFAACSSPQDNTSPFPNEPGPVGGEENIGGQAVRFGDILRGSYAEPYDQLGLYKQDWSFFDLTQNPEPLFFTVEKYDYFLDPTSIDAIQPKVVAPFGGVIHRQGYLYTKQGWQPFEYVPDRDVPEGAVPGEEKLLSGKLTNWISHRATATIRLFTDRDPGTFFNTHFLGKNYLVSYVCLLPEGDTSWKCGCKVPDPNNPAYDPNAPCGYWMLQSVSFCQNGMRVDENGDCVDLSPAVSCVETTDPATGEITQVLYTDSVGAMAYTPIQCNSAASAVFQYSCNADGVTLDSTELEACAFGCVNDACIADPGPVPSTCNVIDGFVNVMDSSMVLW